MAEYTIQDTTLTAIGDAIRAKTGSTELITPENMPTEIEGMESGGGASTAEDVSYINTQLPNVKNVKTALDELVPNSHTHDNKSILDLISAVGGKLQYNGSDVGLKGDKGDTPNIQIGTVEPLPAESPATASMTGTPESPLLNLGIPQGASGSGISVTGATVGQTVRIAAVDENGVPTAWEAVDMPNEEWVELVNATVDETSIPILDLGDYAINFRKIRFFICAEAMTPTSVTFALSISNTTTGSAYNVCSITNFGNESAVSKAIIDFEPLIKDGFCRVSYSWAVPPTASVKTSNILYQYNSYDYDRLRTARYFRPNLEFPAGTTITIEGVRK